LPYKEKEIEKKYYTIGEVAEIFNVATSHIRFWESEFDVIKPKKNKKGNRQFTKDDIEKIKLIYHLVKEKGFTLQGARETIRAENIDKLQDNIAMIDSLKRIRSFLTEVRNQLG